MTFRLYQESDLAGEIIQLLGIGLCHFNSQNKLIAAVDHCQMGLPLW